MIYFSFPKNEYFINEKTCNKNAKYNFFKITIAKGSITFVFMHVRFTGLFNIEWYTLNIISFYHTNIDSKTNR